MPEESSKPFVGKVVPAVDAALAARVHELEQQVARLRKALRPYYDIDGKGFVG